jgi:hypothetical protein
MQKFTPQLFLRLGLGAMFVYSGLDILLHPTAWTWALRGLPAILANPINQFGAETYLRAQGIAELAMAAALFAWFLPRWLVRIVAFFAALEMAAILVFFGVDTVTYRDIGLLGAALALLFDRTERF